MEDRLTDISSEDLRMEMVELHTLIYEVGDSMEFMSLRSDDGREMSIDSFTDSDLRPSLVGHAKAFYDDISEKIANRAKYGSMRMYPNGFHHWNITVLMRANEAFDFAVRDEDMMIGVTPNFIYKLNKGDALKGLSPSEWMETKEYKDFYEIYIPFFKDVMKNLV